MKPAVPVQLLGGLSPRDFLTQHWQREPLLVRSAWPGIEQLDLSPDELAGLACEEEIHSRIVLEQGEKGPWELRTGPFLESDFATLPETRWTLLVSDVEKHVPELRVLIEPFRFIPDWRIDDLMISYAPVGGSVGPHTDQYDVFLLQLAGRRRWQIARDGDSDDTLPGTELSILRHFNAEQEWVLGPGDMLYLPPGVAHHGVSEDDDCLTASIGFRAPSQQELISGWLETLMDDPALARRFGDAGRPPADEPGEIDAQSLDRMIAFMQTVLDKGREQLPTWLGAYLTEPALTWHADFEPGELDEDAVRASLVDANTRLIRHPAARFAFRQTPDGKMNFFANGRVWTLPDSHRSRIATLCRDYAYDAGLWQGDALMCDLLVDLFRYGALDVEE
ncbi:MAG: cupin domain-containing protein [Gammaproteobacteria bacterium]